MLEGEVVSWLVILGWSMTNHTFPGWVLSPKSLVGEQWPQSKRLVLQ